MAVELRYPVYIELLTKDRGFFAGSAKALQMIQALTGQYGKLFAAARKVESSSRYFKDVQAGMLGVKSAASEARVAVVGLAASFAAFEGGKALLKGTVADIKEAAKFQTALAGGRTTGISSGVMKGLKQSSLRQSMTLPGASPTAIASEKLALRPIVGGMKSANNVFPAVENAAYIYSAKNNTSMKAGFAWANQQMQGMEPFMNSKDYGSKAYDKRLTKLFSLSARESMLSPGTNFGNVYKQIGQHSHGLAPQMSYESLKALGGIIRASGGNAASFGPAFGTLGHMLGGGIPVKALPAYVAMGLVKMGKMSYAQAISGQSPMELLHSKSGMKNEAGWITKTFVPHIEAFLGKQGVNTKSRSAVVGALQHLNLGAHITSLVATMIARGSQVKKFEKQLHDTGSLSHMASVYLKTFNGQLLVLHGRFESLKTVLGDPLIKRATQLLTGFVDVVTKFGDWLASHPIAAQWVSLGAALAGIVGVIAGGAGLLIFAIRLFKALGKLTAAIDIMNAAVKGAGVEMGAVATGASAMAKGIGLLGLAIKGFMAFSIFKTLMGTSPTAKIAGQMPNMTAVQRQSAAQASIGWYNGLPAQKRAMMAHVAAKDKLPLNMMIAQLYHESGGNPLAVSPHGKSIGLAQFTKPTWALYGHGSRKSFTANVYAEGAYMHHLMKKHGGNPIAALAAYNGSGPAAATYGADVNGISGSMASLEHFGTKLHTAEGRNIIIHGPIHIHAATGDVHKALVKGVKKALQASTNAGGQYHSRVQTGGT